MVTLQSRGIRGGYIDGGGWHVLCGRVVVLWGGGVDFVIQRVAKGMH